MEDYTYKNNTFRIIFNIIVWLCFFSLPFFFFPYNREASPFQSTRFLYWFIFSDVYLLVFFYSNGMFFIPRLLAQKKIFVYALVVLACFLLYLMGFYLISKASEETRRMIEERMHLNRPHRPRSFYFFSPGPITLFLLALIASSGGKIVERWFNAEKIREQIGKQQLQTELAMLKSQVNPHFLFNTLNSIYTLALVNDDKAPDAVMKLSRIMRYTLEESVRDSVQLTSEIEFIKSYIDLQKLRLTDNVNVHLEVIGNVEYVQVPVLLFVPFIENAFKYGVSTHHISSIDVMIKVAADQVAFTCVNDVFDNESLQASTGLGIQNVRRRLELLFGKNFTLETVERDKKFYLNLVFPTTNK